MASQITTVLIENNKGEQTYGVYLMTEHGICNDQEIYSYDERAERGAAFAKAQKKARDWAAEYKAKIETNW